MIRLAKVLAYPDERLAQVSRPVPVDDDCTMRKVRELVYTLLETMHDLKGWGISAIQIGVPVRVCIAHVPAESATPLIMVNPTIVSTSAEQVSLVEGCLSFSGRRETLERPERVTIKRWNEFGQFAEPQEFGGWMARAILHELDHLDGITLRSHMKPAVGKLYDRMVNRKAERRAARRATA